MTGIPIRERRDSFETQRAFGRRKYEDGDLEGSDASTSQGTSKVSLRISS